MPRGVALIDSASVTARVVVDFLDTHHLRAEAKEGKSRFLVTGDPSPFAAIAERFLNETVTVERAIISSAVTVVPFDVRHR
jgi:glutamate racemase